jgi:hypothetical protein
MPGIVFALTGHGVNAGDKVLADFLRTASAPVDSIMLAHDPERVPDVRAHHVVPVLLGPADQGSGPNLTEYVPRTHAQAPAETALLSRRSRARLSRALRLRLETLFTMG